MLSIGKVTPEMGAHYFSKEDYYSQEDGPAKPEFYGKGLKFLGIKNDFNRIIFEKLLSGKDLNGDPLRQSKQSGKHRAAFDLTFSAPKSVSIAILIGGDKDLLKAHQEAVKFSLNYVEDNFIGSRVGFKENRSFLNTKNMISSLFHHGTSRLHDPQIHTHCVILNTTLEPSGKWKAIHNDHIYRNSLLLGTIYQKKLADLIIKMGYEIAPSKNGTFEILGYTKEQLNYFSKRKNQIDEEILNNNMTSTGKAKATAVLINRNNKVNISPEKLKLKWLKESKKVEIRHPIKNIFNKKKNINWKFATQHLSQKQSTWTKEKLLLETLRANINRGSINTILKKYKEKSEVITLNSKNNEIQLTNFKTIQYETYILDTLKQGNASRMPILDQFEYDEFSKIKGYTTGQKEAFKHAMTSKDFLSAWVGVAGSGKSYALNDVRHFAQMNNYEVLGLAPDSNTAKELEKSSKIKSQTLDRFLVTNKKLNKKQQLWVIDEAGKISTKKMYEIIKKAQENENTRILLVGDTRQIGAVEAGSPFSLMLKNGIIYSELLEHRRQKNNELLKSVEFASQMINPSRSIDGLMKHTKEIKTKKSRIKNVVKSYLELDENERKNTLILTDLNKDRLELTKELRKELKINGIIKQKDHELSILKSKDISNAQKKYTSSFEVGELIVPFKDDEKNGLKRNEKYLVTKINNRNGNITLNNDIEIHPKNINDFSIYTKSIIQISEGDKLQFTKNHEEKLNRQNFVVKKIKNNKLYYENNEDPIDISDSQFIDYAHVNTTYSSQGKTCDNVIFLADSSISRQTWYVGISRARKNVQIITDNIEKLKERVEISKVKTNALDNQINHKIQQEKSLRI